MLYFAGRCSGRREVKRGPAINLYRGPDFLYMSLTIRQVAGQYPLKSGPQLYLHVDY